MTGGTAVIDRFTDTFSRYIDSGFGLVHGEVASLASTLIAIDMTIAGLFWALSAEGEDVVARLIRKTLFIGAFAFIISNWSGLARIIFDSFAGLGLKASGTSISADQLLHPGKLAQVGIDAGKPILTAISAMSGFMSIFNNLIQIIVLLIAWLVVVLSLFVLSIQLFITLIEFKLTTLAGFVLVPFGLFNRTAFLAERTLGNVLASGVKVLVMAVIVGIGSSLFGEFTQGFPAEPSLEDALTIMLASLTLLGLGIFGPGIAAGLGSGAPQLGAGAAVGTALVAGGLGAAGAMGIRTLAGDIGEGARQLKGAVMPSSRSGPSGSSSAGAAPGGGTGPSSPAGGASPLRPAAVGASAAPSSGQAMGGSAQPRGAGVGQGSASSSAGAGSSSSPSETAPGERPEWAARLQREQAIHRGLGTAVHALRSGDDGGGGAALDLTQE